MERELVALNNHPFSALGIDIEFPFNPYGIQRAMMSRILLALTNRQHCLIESPTGTGKTLVLLCSALAWQRKSKQGMRPVLSKSYKEKIIADKDKKDPKARCTCGRQKNRELDDGDEIDEIGASKLEQYKYERKSKKLKTDGTGPFVTENSETNDSECQVVEISVLKSVHNQSGQNCDEDIESEKCHSCRVLDAELIYKDLIGEDSQDSDLLNPDSKASEMEVTLKKSSKVPKIYYGTRTHKQITQVIREVNKTEYRNQLKMTVLSSRDRACIKDDVRELASRNDKCMELLREQRKKTGPGCPFYVDQKSRDDTYMKLLDKSDDRAFDIEDAAVYGRKEFSCPFYGLRSLQQRVDITFCPYNYILDSSIRQAMNINLKDSIIILDEAHNIEDTCRESASWTITSKAIEEICSAVSKCKMIGTEYTGYEFFVKILQNIILRMRTEKFQASYKNSGEEWSTSVTYQDAEMLMSLDNFGLSPSDMENIKEHLKIIKGGDDTEEDSKEGEKRDRDSVLSMGQMQMISQMVLVLEYMYGQKRKYAYDFKIIMTRSIDNDFNRLTAEQKKAADGVSYLYEFKIACFNPGVAFGTIKDLAWSVIVASGTLSPLESLKTELGTDFGYIFEGSHVISEEQLWATVIDRGPNGITLNCSYEQSNQLKFQDELGLVILNICLKVPYGILLFFPSYQRMEILFRRWTQTGIIKEIRRLKAVYRERKELSPAAFEKELADYNRDAKKKGAVLMAVCRGKVSEGIDFSDDAARAVITIGIPFPNVKDTLVDLKRRYNDTKRVEYTSMLTGSDWYSGQAFRALNQALGRCIRHKLDWGCIIMIDSRLKNPSNVKNISRWVRMLTKSYPNYESASSSLQKFIDRRMAIDAGKQVEIDQEN